jgi:NAD-dependent deacetylase
MNPPPEALHAIDRLADELVGARRLMIVTGAGVSAESGLATFRGPGGLWQGRDPLSLASPGAFEADPVTVWEFYLWRREQAAQARPNAAHHAIRHLEGIPGLDVLLVTQNVDGLHEAAGSHRAIELHGRLFSTRCHDCPRPTFDDRPGTHHASAPGGLPPRCDRCGGTLRPGVVWFGEMISPADYSRILTWIEAGRVDGCLVVGTTALIGYIQTFVAHARRAGARLAEIHLDEGESHVASGLVIHAPAGLALPRFAERLASARAVPPDTPPPSRSSPSPSA